MHYQFFGQMSSEFENPNRLPYVEQIGIQLVAMEKEKSEEKIKTHKKKNYIIQAKVHTLGYHDRYCFIALEPNPCNPRSRTNLFWTDKILDPQKWMAGSVVSFSYYIHTLIGFGGLQICTILE